MPRLFGCRISLFLLFIIGFCATSHEGHALGKLTVVNAPPVSYSGNASQGPMNIQWPMNNINMSQLQNILSQNPGVNQFNIQFPNQANWGVTPDMLQSLLNTYQGEAQSVGVKGQLPDLSFSSLAATAIKSQLPQLSINPNGDVKSQLDGVLKQMRYNDLDLSSALPDWFKQIIIAIYDAVYSAFEFMSSQLGGLFHR